MANEKELVKEKTKQKDNVKDNVKDKDQKKRSVMAAAKARAQKQNKTSLRDYFRGVRVELRKVVWPTPKELTMYTWTVILTCFVFAIFFWVADSVFLQGLKLALGFEFMT